METLFTWVHLSDLHVRAPREGAQVPGARLLAALEYDLEAHAGERVDAVLVSGDVSWSGQREEYVAADAFLVQAARVLGLGPERVHVIAGNHDVDRGDGRAALTAKLVGELRQGRRRFDAALEHARAREVLSSRLYAYAVFAATFGPPPADEGAPPQEMLWWSRRVDGRGGLRVRVVGLCTAFLASGDADSDRGALRLGDKQLRDAASTIAPGELVIALSHHPARGGWLADERDVEAWLREHAHVHATGHPHDPIAEEARAGSPGPFMWIAAGASPQKRKVGLGAERRLGYSVASVVRSDDGAVALRIVPRRWSAEGNRFVTGDPDLPSGEIAALRPLRLALPARASPSALPPAPNAPPPPIAASRPSAPPRPFLSVGTPVKPVIAARPSAPPPPLSARTVSRPRSTGLFEGPGALLATPVPLFAGRVAEMDHLAETLADPDTTSATIAGAGGVGKTALVQHFIATRAAALFDEGVWLDARDLPGEIARVARRFGLAPEPAPRIEDALRSLREALDGRRVLIVVDAAASGVVDPLAVPVLGGAARTVVATRLLGLHEDLGRGARELRLAAWDDATCRDHLRALAPALAGEPAAALDALTRRVGGLPLAVRLLGRQLARPDVTAAALLARLDTEPLAALDRGERPDESTLGSTFQPAFDALGPALRRVLVAISACAPATRAATVAEIAGVRVDEAALALEAFAEQSLVEHAPDDERPFRLPAALRIFLRAQPGAAEAESTHEGLFLARVLTPGDARSSPDLTREVPEILAVVDRRAARGDAAGAWELLAAVLGVLERRDRFGEFVTAARRILGVAPEDGPIAAAVLAHLGLALASLGDLAGARDSLTRSLAIAEQRGLRDTEAFALGGLGRALAMLGDLDRAAAHHRRAAALHEQLGRRRLFAVELGNLGFVRRRQGDVSDAVEHLERALAIHEELGETEGRAEVLGGLGLCFRDIGELASAVEYFRRALAIHEELGRRAGQATMLGNLGNTYRALGEVGRAVDHLERALAIYEDLGLPEGQGAALGNLGACHRALGDLPRARDRYERAIAVFRRVGLPDAHPHVRVVLGALGQLSRA